MYLETKIKLTPLGITHNKKVALKSLVLGIHFLNVLPKMSVQASLKLAVNAVPLII